MSGELDLDTVPALRAELTRHLTPATGGFIVDLRAVTFCASIGLAMLLELNDRANEQGIPFVVVADHSPVLRPMRVLALDDVLAVCSDVATAHRVIGTV